MKWRLGVAGFPIDHSLSPLLHETGLKLAQLDGSSRRVPLGAQGASGLREVMIESFDALSVTMPLKGAAVEQCDWLDPVAKRTGMVNSLLLRSGQLLGSNTDGQGFVDALRGQFDFSARGARVLVLGAGGAARGIIDALMDQGTAHVALVGRSIANVTWLTTRFERVREASCHEDDFDLVVNTTPLDARTSDDQVLSGVSAATIAIDITYEPRMSLWRARHDQAGCPSANGLGMLAYQAALQMQWWWNRPMDGARLLKEIA